MNCRSAQRHLAACRPDDQVPPELAAHLRQCALCRSVFKDDRALWGLLAAYTVPPSNAPRADDVFRRCRASKLLVWFPSSLIPTRGLAAAVSAVVMMGVMGGFWCGRTVIDLRFRPAAREAEEANILTTAPPGSIVAAYLDLESEPER